MKLCPLAGRLLAGLALVALALPAAAQTFTGVQKAELGGIIREYLLKNPEVLQEAINELQRRTASSR